MELLTTLRDAPDWYDDAQCVGTSSDVFFPESKGKGVKWAQSISIAKSICAVCPVQEPCLEDAMRNNEKNGIWGGLTFNERKRLRTRRAL